MALQKLCLDVIVNNFERYYSKFPNSGDAVLNRSFEFLQRKFSYEMASSLYKLDDRNKYIINFFVNQHLKELDFYWLKHCSMDTIVAKFKEVGPVLQKLRITRCRYGMPLPDLTCHLRNLRVMTLRDYCDDEILKSLGEFCPNLLELDITNSHAVSDEGIKRLCTKEAGESTGLKLRKIGLNGCDYIHDNEIAYLIKHMPTLEIIDYPYLPQVLYSMHSQDLLQIDTVEPYNLLKLRLPKYHPNFPDLLKICSCLCPRVKYLFCYIRKKENLKSLNAFCELQLLCLDNCFGSKVEIDQLLRLIGKTICYLFLSSVSVSVFALANYCPSLKFLRLKNVDMNNDNRSSVEFPCLERFFLHICSPASAEAIGRLCKSSPNLEVVAFKECNWLSSNEQADVLMCCEKNPIKRIDLTDSEVRYPFVEGILKTCHSLKSLTLDDNCINTAQKIELAAFVAVHPSSPKIIFNDSYEYDDITTCRDLDFGGDFSD